PFSEHFRMRLFSYGHGVPILIPKISVNIAVGMGGFWTGLPSILERIFLNYRSRKKPLFFCDTTLTPQFTFLTPIGNRCITPCVCVKEPSRLRGVLPTAGGLSVHKGTVFCRTIRRNIQRYWILRRMCRSISC